MTTLIFSLRGVPEDEAHEIRLLLSEHNIDYYETSAGNWGISMPALWINNSDDLEQVQKLLDEYHKQRQSTQKELYEKLKKTGGNKKILDVLIEQPIRILIYVSAILFILYLYVRMLFEFGL